jgi:uncharacterized protein (TIGR02246 family)
MTARHATAEPGTLRRGEITMATREPTDQTAEHAAISDVIATLQHAQQHERVDEFVGLMRPDAVWTTGGGRVLVGRDAIAAFTRTVLPGAMATSTQTYDIQHVTFIRPDVAAVKVRQRTVTLDGQPIEDAPEGSPLYVMARETDGWRLVACQNTLVVDG